MIELKIPGTRVLLVHHTELRQFAEQFVHELGDPLEHGQEGLVFIGLPLIPSTLEDFLNRTNFTRCYVNTGDLTPGAFDSNSSSVTLVAHLSPEGFLYALKAASKHTCYVEIDSDIAAFLRRSREMGDFSEMGWLLRGAWNAHFENWETGEFRELLQCFVAIAEGGEGAAAANETVVAHISARLAQGD